MTARATTLAVYVSGGSRAVLTATARGSLKGSPAQARRAGGHSSLLDRTVPSDSFNPSLKEKVNG